MRKAEIEHWDDERELGNGILVTLRYLWSFEPQEHAGVRGFDTPTEARAARAYPCRCALCRKATKFSPTEGLGLQPLPNNG